MPIKGPTVEGILEIAAHYGFQLSADEALVYQKAAERALLSYDFLDTLPEPARPVKYPRGAGRKPGPTENLYGGIAWLCDIQGAPSGKLSGKTVAIKDNTSVFGLPLQNGSRLMAGYIPNTDASVVTRILDEGGRIVAKSVCDSFCFAATGHTPDSGPVRNPANPEYLASGSSGGSAVLVALGFCDMALGGDQGGSIRMPASWCGVVGLKPTYGLVPYTGIFPIEPTLDHAGPMAKTVADCALMLEVIQGKDGLDFRQSGSAPRCCRLTSTSSKTTQILFALALSRKALVGRFRTQGSTSTCAQRLIGQVRLAYRSARSPSPGTGRGYIFGTASG